ncbi:hypothetical protein [Christiangramia salexigens]|uniref:Uncharacterized protein n=1 Tax=Christiangramia salexigens TaxID=1913577 RepID=A0A1L3J6X3_9FLAO|nr:hypothetical protein [Christiangramia salexigens]APG60886.1 hypothetical protein LPB144_10910 [Christiangramia salexigens]
MEIICLVLLAMLFAIRFIPNRLLVIKHTVKSGYLNIALKFRISVSEEISIINYLNINEVSGSKYSSDFKDYGFAHINSAGRNLN